MFTLKMTILSALLLGTFSANAALVSTDWKSAGDAKATLDTATGLEWLDLSHTLGNSMAEVQSTLSTTFAGWRLPTKQEVNQLLSGLFTLTSFNEGYSAITYSYERVGGGSAITPGYQTVYSQFVNWGSKVGNTYQKQHYGASYYQENRNSTFLYLDDATGSVLRGSLNYQYHQTYSTGRETASVKLTEDFSTGFTLSQKELYTSVFLVSDGGTTLSSLLDPNLNAQNPNAPINRPPEVEEPQQPADVSGPAVGWFALSLMGAAFLRRKKNA